MLTTSQLPNPKGHAPLRRAQSIRRMTIIEASWPEGRFGTTRVKGVGQDIYTANKDDTPEVMNRQELSASFDTQKNITAISSSPPLPSFKETISINGIGQIRRQIPTLFNGRPQYETPLYQLIHDITGILIISDWAWASRPAYSTPKDKTERKARLDTMAGACTGFSPGSRALKTDGGCQSYKAAVVEPMAHPHDPKGWLDFPDQHEIEMRRARRMDLWVEDGIIFIDATFQDSTKNNDGNRLAVHEYSLLMQASIEELTIISLDVTPHILPFNECPMAIKNSQLLVNKNLMEITDTVSSHLRKTNGCTHLNDALRSIAATPALLETLYARKP